MRTRTCARLILLDQERRLLLFNFDDERATEVNGDRMPPFWIMPGGGLKAGESYEAAARRELWEETGIQEVTLSPCVWIRDVRLGWLGQPMAIHERFYLAQIQEQQIDVGNMEEAEIATFRGHRWWTYSALKDSTETFFPRQLSQLIKPVLDGVIPFVPIRLTD